MRQYSGFGSAAQTNERYRFLLEQGQHGAVGRARPAEPDRLRPDDPDVEEEVGGSASAIDTLADMEILFAGIPLGEISTSFTINGTAAVILAMYVACRREAGRPADRS